MTVEVSSERYGNLQWLRGDLHLPSFNWHLTTIELSARKRFLLFVNSYPFEWWLSHSFRGQTLRYTSFNNIKINNITDSENKDNNKYIVNIEIENLSQYLKNGIISTTLEIFILLLITFLL